MSNFKTEFSHLIPPHSPAELEQLEQSIRREGCRDALVVWRGVLLDGYARYRICRKHNLPYRIRTINLPDRTAAEYWIIRNQFARRNLPIGVRCALALRLEPEIVAQAHANQQSGKRASTPINTDEVLARIAGVSRQTMQRFRKIPRTRKNLKQLNQGETTINHLFNMQRIRDDEKRRAAERAAARPDQLDHFYCGDFRHSKIPDGSLSLIVTDPLWQPTKENLALLPDLAEWASRKLEVGGSFICYLGHLTVPYAIPAFSKFLRYHWMFCGRRNHAKSMLHNNANYYRVNVGWRPIAWYVKGSFPRGEDYLNDYLELCKDVQKTEHEYQQPWQEAAYFIDHLCPKMGLLLTPARVRHSYYISREVQTPVDCVGG